MAECVKRGQPVLTVGGAGGRRDATRIRCGDLGESQGDELLRQVRKKLRRDHGFAQGEGNIYNVPCVFSNEKPLYPWADGTCRQTEPEPGSNLCARLCERFRHGRVCDPARLVLSPPGEIVAARDCVEGR